MNIEDLLIPLRILLKTRPVSEAVARAALVLAYYYLYHVSKSRLENAHRAKLSGVIKSHLEERDIDFEQERVDSLDWKYMRQFGINLHHLIPLALGMLQVKTADRFKAYRNNRNIASYDIKAMFDPQKHMKIAEEIVEFAQSIKSL